MPSTVPRCFAAVVFVTGVWMFIPGVSAAIADERTEFFETHIRPALIEHCLECHSSDGDEIGGGLALDSKEGWNVGGDSGPAIVPGNLDASPLIEALRYDGLEMPPSGKLPDDVIGHFETWVQQGAVDPRQGLAKARSRSGIDIEEGRKFWAYQPLAKPSVSGLGADAIDELVARRRDAAGVPHPTSADPATRLRRLSYDLTGLPPSAETLARFVREPTDAVWAELVDDMLSSPSFGQHWARMWLDVARYADSNGSDFNATYHDAWRYRDYVVDSFNNDRSFATFVREQIAGDLLPSESKEDEARQIVATGFLALGAKMLSERDKAKLTLDIVDEQIDTVGKAFLGMTLGCARCHDHKFDPIPTNDYYALAGIFQSTETVEGEIIRYVSDLVRTPLPVSAELAAAVAAHDVKKAELTKRIKAVSKQIDMIRESASLSGLLSVGVVLDTDQLTLSGNWKASTYSKNRLGPDYVHNDRQPETMTAQFKTELPEPGEYEVRLSYSAAGSRDKKVPVRILTATGDETVYVNQQRQPRYGDTWEPIGRFEFDDTATVTISTAGTSGYVIVDAVQIVPVSEADVTAVAANDSQLVEKRTSLEAELKELEKGGPGPLPTALAVRDVSKPADCAVRIRGEPHRMGAEVPRGFLQVAMTSEPPAMPVEQSGRIELADWIASPDNPLTARVFVNRVWANLFGTGIVRTPHNFGELGERPTHPLLLDWLAASFIENDWSSKSLIRSIVLSKTYQMSGATPGDVLELDPENRLLTRANRRPLTAEQLRDSLLLLSGRLDMAPTADPMKGIGKLISNNGSMQESAKAVVSDIVRSIYLPVVRNEVEDVLAVFDFADPEVSVGRRAKTNVPSQALFLMNSELMREAAGSIARSVAGQSQPVETLVRRTLSREPDASMEARLQSFVASYSDPVAGLEAACHALLASTSFRLLE